MTAPQPEPSGPDPLQFDRAERAGAAAPGAMACGVCGTAIGTEYFEAGGKILCERCATAVRTAAENRGRFGRAALFGLGGATLGAAIYYAVLAITGYEIGLIAILVGFVVGKAVSVGGASGGGRRYQVLAVVLTYLSIGATFVPLVLSQRGERTSGTADSLARSAPVADAGTREVKPFRTIVVGMLALIALAAAMPLLAGFGGLPASLIGLLILGFALQQAWRINHRNPIRVTGPFRAPGVPPEAPLNG